MKKVNFTIIFIFCFKLLVAQEYSFTADKQLHTLGGGILGTVGYVTTYDLTDGNRFASYLGGTATASLGGLLKELYDSKVEGLEFSGADMLYTALGGLVSSLITDLIMSKQTYKKRKRRKIIMH